MAQSAKSNQEERDKDLEELKKIADDLGVDYSDKIGYETLEKRIKGAKKEKEAAAKAKPAKLSPLKVKIMKAKSLKKVRIVNMDKEDAGSTTAFAGVHNMHMDLSRVVPLNMDIALEEALVADLEARKMLVPTPELDNNGKATGNFKMIEAPKYAVARLS